MVLCPSEARRQVFCAGCDEPIFDRFLLQVLDRAWHAGCVRCVDCRAVLNDKCFSRDGKLFCKDDFFRRFGTKCSGCGEGVSPSDLVRRARDRVFHLACFICSACRRQLTTGDQLYVLGDGRFICREDYLAGKALPDKRTLPADIGSEGGSEDEDDCTRSDDDDSKSCEGDMSQLISAALNDPLGTKGDPLGLVPPGGPASALPLSDADVKDDLPKDESVKPDKSDKNNNTSSEGGKSGDENNPSGKRRGPRTTIKAKQLETLKAAFAATPKPTRHIREQLAKETGLTMRVIQVWFQNRRSKERRMKQLSAINARRSFFRNGPGGSRRMRPLQPCDDLPPNGPFPYFDGAPPEFYGGPPGPGFYDFFPGGPPPPGGDMPPNMPPFGNPHGPYPMGDSPFMSPHDGPMAPGGPSNNRGSPDFDLPPVSHPSEGFGSTPIAEPAVW